MIQIKQQKLNLYLSIFIDRWIDRWINRWIDIKCNYTSLAMHIYV